jgi:hypothetical protein
MFLGNHCVHLALLRLAANSDSWRPCSSTPFRTGNRRRRFCCARAIARVGASRSARWRICRSWQALIAGIAALLDGGKVSGKRAAEPGFEIVRSLPHGHVAAVQAMIRKLGLERTLQGGTGVDKRVRNLIEAMIIQRIIAPGSKLAFHRALAPATATSSLALSIGLVDVAEREVYAALDWLIEQQTRIEAALAKKHLIDGTLVLYDVSSSYMEGRCCALAKPGYSRDHRPDRPQIVYGLLCAPDGTPVAVEVFEGNTSDPQTDP